MTEVSNDESTHHSRRKFIAGVGLGTAGAIGAAALTPSEALAEMIRQEAAVAATQPDRFGRMFPNLPSFMTTTQPNFGRVVDALTDISQFGGKLDAKDPLGRGPVELITAADANVNNQNNPTHTAGT